MNEKDIKPGLRIGRDLEIKYIHDRKVYIGSIKDMSTCEMEDEDVEKLIEAHKTYGFVEVFVDCLDLNMNITKDFNFYHMILNCSSCLSINANENVKVSNLHLTTRREDEDENVLTLVNVDLENCTIKWGEVDTEKNGLIDLLKENEERDDDEEMNVLGEYISIYASMAESEIDKWGIYDEGKRMVKNETQRNSGSGTTVLF